jgi:hypothetical protein
VTLAVKHNWTPEQVSRMDPHFVNELFMRHEAEADYQAAEAKKAERKNRRGRKGR